jgi:aspartyl-tRNA synthetase
MSHSRRYVHLYCDLFVNLIAGLLSHIWKKTLNIKLQTPFMRMSYKEALARYGVDKPDLRYEMEIKNLTDTFRNTKVIC